MEEKSISGSEIFTKLLGLIEDLRGQLGVKSKSFKDKLENLINRLGKIEDHLVAILTSDSKKEAQEELKKAFKNRENKQTSSLKKMGEKLDEQQSKIEKMESKSRTIRMLFAAALIVVIIIGIFVGRSISSPSGSAPTDQEAVNKTETLKLEMANKTIEELKAKIAKLDDKKPEQRKAKTIKVNVFVPPVFLAFGTKNDLKKSGVVVKGNMKGDASATSFLKAKPGIINVLAKDIGLGMITKTKIYPKWAEKIVKVKIAKDNTAAKIILPPKLRGERVAVRFDGTKAPKK